MVWWGLSLELHGAAPLGWNNANLGLIKFEMEKQLKPPPPKNEKNERNNIGLGKKVGYL